MESEIVGNIQFNKDTSEQQAMVDFQNSLIKELNEQIASYQKIVNTLKDELARRDRQIALVEDIIKDISKKVDNLLK